LVLIQLTETQAVALFELINNVKLFELELYEVTIKEVHSLKVAINKNDNVRRAVASRIIKGKT
jgi:hypothetical protein